MAKEYILTKKLWDDNSLNRLIKKIQKNAEDDRNIAKVLLDKVQNAFNDLISSVQEIPTGEDSSIQSVDAFHKLVNASCQALNQMGIANEKLLKVAQLLQKHRHKEMDLGGKSSGSLNEAKGSLFNSLKLALEEDEEDT